MDKRKASPEDQITAIKAQQALLTKHDTKTSIDIRTTVTMTQKPNQIQARGRKEPSQFTNLPGSNSNSPTSQMSGLQQGLKKISSMKNDKKLQNQLSLVKGEINKNDSYI